ncbi:hypothetical protein CXF97_12040 [Pseudomonas sp. Choline-02u-1]|nr:hypothetical protein CXF97_12040 [Pseudomonas sp. Choline-02u-1]
MAGSQSYCSWLMLMIVPTLCVGMLQWTLCVRFGRDAERPGQHSHAERGNERRGRLYLLSRIEKLAMCSSPLISAEWSQLLPPMAAQVLNTC